MKINRGHEVSIIQSLTIVSTNEGEEDLVLLDGITFIKVITDNTDFDRELDGVFGYIDDNNIYVGDEMIPIEYIEEIEIVD